MKCESIDLEIETRVNRIKYGGMNLQPDFQRGEIWTLQKTASKESPKNTVHSIERINENGIRRKRGVSLSHNRENRNVAFLMPSCYALGAEKALIYKDFQMQF